jgi:hypothetical protein
MTKQFILATLVAVSSLMTGPVNAGFLDKLIDRVGDKVENVVSGKVARKAGDKAGDATDAVINPEVDNTAGDTSDDVINTEDDDKVDKTTDLVSNPDTSGDVVEQPSSSDDVNTSSDSTSANPLTGFGGLGGMLQALQKKVNIEDSYRFELKMKSEITSEGNVNVMEQSFSNNALLVQVDGNQSMILDMKNEAMIMVDEQAKTKYPMSTQLLKQVAKMGGASLNKKIEESLSVGRLEKTGKTKEILGYKASQWTYSEGSDNGEIWITEELDFDFVDFNRRLMSMFDNGGEQFSVDFSKLQGQLPNGLPLETTNYVDGQVESQMKVVSVSKEPQVIDLSGYREQTMLSQ